MAKFLQWFVESNRYLHFLLGIVVGLGANSLYCALYTAFGVSGALEFKDKLWGSQWDWVDWGCTFVGIMLGYAVHFGVASII